MKYILTHKDNSKLNLHTRTPYSSVLEAPVSNAWQGYNELILKVSVEGVPGWRHFDKIEIEEIDFFLHEWNTSEHVDERISTYTLHFYGPEKMIIEASPLTDMDEDGISVFRKLTSVTGDLPFFGNMICNCINYRHYDPQTGLRVKQNTVKLGIYPAGTKHLNVDFSESNAFAGLKAICEKFGVSYSLERNTQGDTDYILNFETEQTVFPVTLSYGKGKGLYAIRRKSLNTKNIKTILTVLGSSKNLPTDYGKNNLELDPTLYPGSIIADATKIAKYGAWNEIYQNEEIMPSRLGTITAIDEADVLSFFDDTLDFDPTGGTVNVVTGQLAGNNFKIRKYNAITHKITVEPLTDENGFTKPSVAPFLFAPGDEYYLVDIPMPGSYLIAAQEELAEAGNAEYDRISQPQVAYEVSLHGKFLRKHEVRPRVGMYLPISDVRWGVDKAILITKVKRDLLKRDDWEYECEISDDPGESLAVCLYKKIQQTGINTRKQEKNQISTIAALRSFAEEKASESLMASQAYAAAQAEAARIAAEAYADGEIGEEEARAIADATAKMNEAKSYALAQAAAAESAAKTYAEAQAAVAQAAAEAVAEAEAESAEISAKAYADGVVSAEEQRAIAEAAAKLTEAKNYAATQASAAEAAANTYSEAKAEAARLAAIASAKTYTDTEVTAAKGYADSTAAAAQSAAEAYALAKANLAETNAEAYADGIVDAEEAARIAEAQAKLNEAKTYAETKATAAETAAKAYADTQLGNFATTVTGDISNLQSQIDGNITTWFYAYVPTTANAPASAWTTTALKNQHLGDLFYNTATGFCYRYQLVGGVYSWQKITDSDITKALADAAAAQDTADSKRRVFVATPVTPYDVGDLWLNNQELYKCKVTRLTGSYVASDWEKGVKYTDDTVANANLVTARAYADTKKAEAIAAAEAAAEAEALAAQTAAEAHADGIVTAEEAARIADVNAKLNTAKTYAETKATEAKNAAEAAAALDATAKVDAVKVGGQNYFVVKTIGRYKDGVIDIARSINNNVPAVRILHDGTFRFAENMVASITDGHYGDSVSVQGTTINVVGNPDGLVGKAISVDVGSELLMYGKTSLSVIDIHYKYDNGYQQSISVETVNELFEHKFIVPDGASQLVLGIGKYPYVAPYTLDRIMLIKGNKQIDYIASVEDVVLDVDLKYTQIVDKLQQFIEDTNITIEGVNNTLQSKLLNTATRAAEAYAQAKANYAETLAKAYADGIVTAEEQRAIADAAAKLTEAKNYVDYAIVQLQSDLAYLINAFADGSTYLSGGLVLSQFMGVTDGETPAAVVAGMAGKDFIEEEGIPVDSPMIFAGASSAQNANGAKFRVYKDGRVYSIDMYVEGSLRSPFRKVDGYWEEDGGDDNVHDNVYIDASGSWSTPFGLLWDLSQSGRRRTIVVRGGSQTITAPSGKYFYEDGLQKSSLYLSSELVDVIGYTDETSFLGWVVLSRNNITTNYKYGRNLRAMAVGRIYPSSGNVADTYTYRTFDGSALTIVNTETGVWQITMPSGWFASANSYILSLTPESNEDSEEIWIKAFDRTATSFKVRTETYAALNSTTVTRAFSFIVHNIEDWPATT